MMMMMSSNQLLHIEVSVHRERLCSDTNLATILQSFTPNSEQARSSKQSFEFYFFNSFSFSFNLENNINCCPTRVIFYYFFKNLRSILWSRCDWQSSARGRRNIEPKFGYRWWNEPNLATDGVMTQIWLRRGVLHGKEEFFWISAYFCVGEFQERIV
jgi:hypothetical protein